LERQREIRVGRFCDKIRYNLPDYAKYFKVVFKNSTFRVYSLNTN